MTSALSSDGCCASPTVGIFAIQGAVLEHADCVRKCGGTVKEVLSPLYASHSQIVAPEN